MRRNGSGTATDFDLPAPVKEDLKGYTKEAEQSVQQDGVAEKPWRCSGRIRRTTGNRGYGTSPTA